jgi:hypothetical protein
MARPEPPRGSRGRRPVGLRTECVLAHRRGQQRDHHCQACRDGSGRLHRHCHGTRRRARRRLGAGAGGKRSCECEALRQFSLRHAAGDGRQLGDGEFLDAAARGRRQGPRDAAHCGLPGVENSGGRTQRRQGSGLAPRQQPPSNLRRAGGQGRGAAGTGQGDAQRPERFQADRAPTPEGRCTFQSRRHRSIHAGCRIARHACRAAQTAATLRGDREIVRCLRRRCRAGCGESSASAAWRGGDREEFLGRQARPRRSGTKPKPKSAARRR